MNRRVAGTLLALTSATSFGVLPVLTKIVFDGHMGLTGVQSTSAGAVRLASHRRRIRGVRARPAASNQA